MSLMLVACDTNQVDTPSTTSTMKEETTGEVKKDSKEEEKGETKETKEDSKEEVWDEQYPRATIEMEDGRKITLKLYPEIAPETVNNFIALANDGFYNGLIFHRVIPGFMAQGGSPDGYGTGGPGYSIKGEFSSNGVENTLSHTRGVISMARADDMDSAGSQFFIVVNDAAANSLDGLYASFGEVVEGMSVVDEIVNAKVLRRDDEYSEDLIRRYQAFGENEPDEEWIQDYIKETSEFNRPVNPPVIKTITVETFGKTYNSPTKLEAK